MVQKDFIEEYPRALHTVHEKMASASDWPDYIAREPYTAEEVSSLADNAFADPANRKFPIHEKAATFLSTVTYYGHCQPDNQLEVALEKAAAVHGITDHCVKVREILDGWEKVAEEQEEETLEKFALSVNFGTDEQPDIKNYLPIDSVVGVEDSSMELAKQAALNELPIEVTREAAKEILKAAKALDVDPSRIHESCRRIGGALAPDFEKAARLVEYRSHVPGMDETGIEIYRDLVKGASANEDRLDDFIKLAIQTDINYGVKYDDLHLDPYQLFYSGDAVDDLKKMAAQTVTIDNVLVPRDIFCRIPGASLEKNFDPGTVEKVASAQHAALTDTATATSTLDALDKDERAALLDMSLAASV